MPEEEPPPETAIVGGGPAGLMAAEVLAGAGLAVTVYERMPSPARKFLLAGRGGLNLTHDEDLTRFLSRYGPAEARLRRAIEAFPPEALRAWCQGLGQPTFIGSSGRVFPESFKASPLLRAWLARLDALGVRIATRHRWTGFDGAGRLVFEAPDGARLVKPAAALLALGGASWPRLGSDGSWAPILADAGIEVAPLKAANAGFDVAWSEVFRHRFEGQPLKRIAAAFAGRTVRGEAIVTARGLEGGVIYALSAPLRRAVEERGEAVLALDLRPDLSAAALEQRLGAPRLKLSASSFLAKRAGLPSVAIGLLREAAGPGLPAGPGALAALIKAVPLRLTGIRPVERAISTAGGIRFDEVDDRLMLRRRPGLFVAGEMLDWEAPTGGYLLQACFSTGVAAARGMLAWLGEGRPGLSTPVHSPAAREVNIPRSCPEPG